MLFYICKTCWNVVLENNKESTEPQNPFLTWWHISSVLNRENLAAPAWSNLTCNLRERVALSHAGVREVWCFSDGRGSDLFFQNSSSVWGVSTASQESLFRTAWIWWLHSITVDSKEWMMFLSTLLGCFTDTLFYRSGQMICWHAALGPIYLSTSARLSLWGPAGRGSSVLPRARPDTTNTLVFRECMCFLMSWVTTCGHVAWFLLLERRGTTTCSRVHKNKVSTLKIFIFCFHGRRKCSVCLYVLSFNGLVCNKRIRVAVK